ncbi:MAG: hypothetical protein ACOVMM_04655 [Chitinophagaceae bacterium]
MQVTFCKKCLVLEKDFDEYFDEENNEVYEFCSNCHSSLDIVTADCMPVKKIANVVVRQPIEKPFNVDKWRQKQQDAQDLQDAKLNKYIDECQTLGKAIAESNYFNSFNKANKN